MKTAIIYYSLDGNCAFAGRILQKLLGADLFEIKTVDTKKRRGIAKYFWGGRQVMMGKKPDLQPLTVDPSAYDRIVLGAPVWAGSPAPAMAAFLDKTPLNGKTIALYCCHGGGKGKAPEKLRALIGGNTVIGEIDLVNPAANPEKAREALEAWAKSLGGN